MELAKRNWHPRNHHALRRLVERAEGPALAVFDWDNTCICGDIGDAFYRLQARRLLYRLTPDEFAAVLPEEVNGRREVTHGDTLLPLGRIKDVLCDSYRRLQPLLMRGGEGDDSPAARDFFAYMVALNSGLEHTAGIGYEYAYRWVVRFTAGLHRAEITRWVEEMAAEQCRAPLREMTRSSADGRVTVSWTDGLRVYAEMRELLVYLRRRGFTVAVVTASSPLVVEAMAAWAEVPCDRLIGMAMHMDGDTVSDRLDDTLECNYGEGKVGNIRRRLEREPLLAAGDSNSDYPMLTRFPGTALRLVIHRDLSGPIRELYARAEAEEEGYLAQRVDFSRGEFRPDGEAPIGRRP